MGDTPKASAFVGSDIDGDDLAFAIVEPPAHGTVVTSGGSGAGFIYTPSPNYHGNDAFTYRATDNGVGSLSSTPGTVSIKVTPTNDKPTCTPSAFSVPEDSDPVSHALIAADIDLDPLAYVVCTKTKH